MGGGVVSNLARRVSMDEPVQDDKLEERSNHFVGCDGGVVKRLMEDFLKKNGHGVEKLESGMMYPNRPSPLSGKTKPDSPLKIVEVYKVVASGKVHILDVHLTLKWNDLNSNWVCLDNLSEHPDCIKIEFHK